MPTFLSTRSKHHALVRGSVVWVLGCTDLVKCHNLVDAVGLSVRQDMVCNGTAVPCHVWAILQPPFSQLKQWWAGRSEARTQTHRHTDTDTDTDTQTHRHRHTDTQTDTDTQAQTDRHTDTDRQTNLRVVDDFDAGGRNGEASSRSQQFLFPHLPQALIVAV